MEIIYDRHEKEWTDCVNDKQKKKHAQTWLEDGTLDKWRHERMLSPILAMIDNQSTWLTIGDGRYGTDAHYILANGGNAHATDVSDKLLKIGKEIGYIKSFSQQNAEKLEFEDESYDYVLIKEAFHHFPRPWIALHEAFRVCRKAVILIEPNDINRTDQGMRKRLIIYIKIILKFILRKRSNKDGYGFEPVGNFIYSITSRELEKFLLGMHYRHIATTGMNDAYEKGVEFVSKNNKNFISLKIHLSIAIQDLLTRLGFLNNSILLAALFKDSPSKKQIGDLKKYQWNYKKLPKNPYLNANK